ncbi:MAG TPA: family 1 glycosylhydrolase [Candidatus Babeliales bacterium]|nr:family 1 glycosylhydrolase [Candidatus Babeliales bacterium]
MRVLSVVFICLFSTIKAGSCAELTVLPKTFLKGIALSAYQNGGDIYGKSNWSHFEQQKSLLGKSTINRNQRCGSAADFWNRALDDIQLIKNLGCNAVRFSIEWAVIEPEQGVFNEEMLNWYEQYIDALIAADIVPTITLHHFVHPQWFDEIGGFQKEQNLEYFLRFSKLVFKRLSAKVPIWYTINEPTVYSFMGFILGMHSPGKVMNFNAAGTVLKNLLTAHCRVYKALKKMPNGASTQIGIVHQILHAHAYSNWSPFGRFTAWFLNFCAAHKQTKKFLQTGIFEYKIPGIVDIYAELPGAPRCYDFIGINYYSRLIVGNKGPTCMPGEIMTDMEYALYPDGIYDAITDMASLGVPIYITENGIPDAKDQHRALFIELYTQKIYEAMKDGFDVRGYFYWTLMDNYEWDRGFDQKFGLYKVDFATKERSLRNGSLSFINSFLPS